MKPNTKFHLPTVFKEQLNMCCKSQYHSNVTICINCVIENIPDLYLTLCPMVNKPYV